MDEKRMSRTTMRGIVAAWVLAVVVTIVALVVVFGTYQQREAACAQHGWTTAQGRGSYCVDQDGVVRQP